jgi:hypothetical protein
MMRNRQFPWRSHQIVLMALVLMRAVRRKPTVNRKQRPIAAVELHQLRMTVPLTPQALAGQSRIVPILRKAGSLQGHRDVSGSAPCFEESHLKPGTGEAHENSD